MAAQAKAAGSGLRPTPAHGPEKIRPRSGLDSDLDSDKGDKGDKGDGRPRAGRGAVGPGSNSDVSCVLPLTLSLALTICPRSRQALGTQPIRPARGLRGREECNADSLAPPHNRRPRSRPPPRGCGSVTGSHRSVPNFLISVSDQRPAGGFRASSRARSRRQGRRGGIQAIRRTGTPTGRQALRGESPEIGRRQGNRRGRGWRDGRESNPQLLA